MLKIKIRDSYIYQTIYRPFSVYFTDQKQMDLRLHFRSDQILMVQKQVCRSSFRKSAQVSKCANAVAEQFSNDP